MESTHNYRVDRIGKAWQPLHTNSFVDATNCALRWGNAVVYDVLRTQVCFITHQWNNDSVQVYKVSSLTGEIDIHERAPRNADFIID
jgi:hypothetical protein